MLFLFLFYNFSSVNHTFLEEIFKDFLHRYINKPIEEESMEYVCIKCGKKMTYQQIKERSITVRNFACMYCNSRILVKSKRPAAKIVRAD